MKTKYVKDFSEIQFVSMADVLKVSTIVTSESMVIYHNDIKSYNLIIEDDDATLPGECSLDFFEDYKWSLEVSDGENVIDFYSNEITGFQKFGRHDELVKGEYKIFPNYLGPKKTSFIKDHTVYKNGMNVFTGDLIDCKIFVLNER